MTDEHPLHDTFVLRFKKDKKKKNDYKKKKETEVTKVKENEWLNEFCEIYTFSTIENFWRLYNNLPPVTSFSINSSYTLFRDNVLPSWEHPKNIDGFSFILYIPNSLQKDYKSMQLKSFLLFIGNYKNYVETLNGLTFDKKFKNYRIVFWFSSMKHHNQETFNSIIEELSIKYVNDTPTPNIVSTRIQKHS